MSAFTTRFTTRFTTPAPIAVIVEVAGAQVRVTASDRTDTVVLVEPIDETSRKDVKVADRTKVEFADGRLSVKTKTAGDKKGSVAITIDLPIGSSLAAYLAYSKVHAEGSLGASELHLASGQVQLDSVDALHASIASGEVTIGQIAGRADIDGAAFTMRIGEVKGTVGFMSSGGQAWIDRADGTVTAQTGSGAIRIGRMSNGRARLTTGSGDIEVGISDGAAASVDVNSERGAVHNFISAPVEQGSSGAKVSVHARTRHGDITVQRVAG